jgi:biopolymer transport protein ExbB/TolQ
MDQTKLSEAELRALVPGEALVLAAVMAVLAIAVIAVVCYKMFKSKAGGAKLPGGYAFEWK